MERDAEEILRILKKFGLQQTGNQMHFYRNQKTKLYQNIEKMYDLYTNDDEEAFKEFFSECCGKSIQCRDFVSGIGITVKHYTVTVMQKAIMDHLEYYKMKKTMKSLQDTIDKMKQTEDINQLVHDPEIDDNYHQSYDNKNIEEDSVYEDEDMDLDESPDIKPPDMEWLNKMQKESDQVFVQRLRDEKAYEFDQPQWDAIVEEFKDVRLGQLKKKLLVEVLQNLKHENEFADLIESAENELKERLWRHPPMGDGISSIESDLWQQEKLRHPSKYFKTLSDKVKYLPPKLLMNTIKLCQRKEHQIYLKHFQAECKRRREEIAIKAYNQIKKHKLEEYAILIDVNDFDDQIKAKKIKRQLKLDSKRWLKKNVPKDKVNIYAF